MTPDFDEAIAACRIFQIESTTNKFRTSYIDGMGTPFDQVKIGKRFFLTADPFDKSLIGAKRFVFTTSIIDISLISENLLVFTTETGSVYRVQYQSQN